MKGVAAAAACLLAACAPAARAAPPAPAASADAALAAMAADDAVRAAFAGADGQALDAVFLDPALGQLRRQVGVLAGRGLRREEEVDERRVVHVSVGRARAEVVLEVRARQRLLGVSQAPVTTVVLRQTRVELVRRAGGWRGDGWTDLRPEEWWPAPGS